MFLQELDFTIETANAERCRKNLQSPRSHVRGQVKVTIFLCQNACLLAAYVHRVSDGQL